MSLTDSALGRTKSGIRLSSRYDIARKIYVLQDCQM